MDLIDTHCHIYYDQYKDIEEVIDRACKNNISRIVCVGVDIKSSYESLALAEKYDLIFSTAGYHPHESKDADKIYLKDIKEARILSLLGESLTTDHNTTDMSLINI